MSFTDIVSVLSGGSVAILSKDNACFSLQLVLQHQIYICLILLTDILYYEVSTISNCSFTHLCYIPGHLILLDLINRIIEEYKSSMLGTYHSLPP
jgi:hypothetical protein